MNGASDSNDRFGSSFTRSLKNRLEQTLPKGSPKLTAMQSIDSQIRHLSFFRTISASKSRPKASQQDQPGELTLASKLITPNRSKLTFDNRTNSSSSLNVKQSDKPAGSLGFQRSTDRLGNEPSLHWTGPDLSFAGMNCTAARLKQTRSKVFNRLHDLSQARTGVNNGLALSGNKTVSNFKKRQDLKGVYSSLDKKSNGFLQTFQDASKSKNFGLNGYQLEVSKPVQSTISSKNNYNMQLFLKKEPKMASTSIIALRSPIHRSGDKKKEDFCKERLLRQGHHQLLELNSPLIRNLSQSKQPQSHLRSHSHSLASALASILK